MATKTTKKSEPKSAVHAGVKRVRVTIRGLAPGLLFQGKGVMELDEGTKKPVRRPPEEEARLRAHWMQNGSGQVLCIPWVNIYQAICTAAGSFKFRGQKTMATVVAATVSCEQTRISLGTTEFETYEDYCRIPPRTGKMVKIGRPLIRKWQVTFDMIVDDEMYAADSLREILAHAGKLVGIGAWRPQLRGPYGRFEVVEFDVE